jgi:FtsP/CotA-like multicopper oxidase with cupredoxin domain
VLFALTAITTAAGAAFDPVACDKTYAFDVREWVVDYLRPTAPPRASPYSIASTNKKSAQLVNNTYPGPAIEATEGDLVCVTVNNNLLAEALVIHWHGQHMRGFPAMDGVYGVTQAGIPAQGGSFTYRWRANKGTHFYHAHMQAMQADRGLKGPIVVHAKNDPHAHLYQEERVVALSDEWQNPGECLKAEGAQPGNPVCMEIEKASWNGVWGDGSTKYPWPMVTVDKGKCYRLRFIAMMGQAQNFQVSISGHNFTLIALDGADVVPIQLSKFNLHAGERADIVLCADQEPGNYLMSAVYDLATFLETAPAPSMPKVDSSKFWSFLNYAGHKDEPGKAEHKILGGYNPPTGTGGGKKPAAESTGPTFDTNLQSNWPLVKNLNSKPQAASADSKYVLDIGVLGPNYEPGQSPYATTDRMYMFTEHKSWKKPATPLLHTKGTCGADGVPFLTVEKNQTVELVINNLSPTAHVLHMHGMRFEVINYAPFSETWCSIAKFDCFFLPFPLAKPLDCPGAREGDPGTKFPDDAYWGCPYDEARDNSTAMLDNPLQKDMISIWRRSWAVIRFTADNPGAWLFHCHMEQHIPTGQMMVLNILPAEQPPIPKDVPTEGPCPVWSSSTK